MEFLVYVLTFNEREDELSKLSSHFHTISRNYTYRRLSCAKELEQNVSLSSQVSQSIMVASARGIVV